jgi:hypothetical protein
MAARSCRIAVVAMIAWPTMLCVPEKIGVFGNSVLENLAVFSMPS